MKQLITKDSYIKETFYRAMEILLEKKDFLDITTTEIIETSGLSRTTFYKHFRDKYELAAWKFGALFAYTLMPDEYTSPDVAVESYRKNITYIYQNRKYFKSLFSYTGQNSFQDYYIKFPVEVVESIAAKSGRKLTDKDYYTITYHSAGAAQVLKDWLQSDCAMSMDDVCELLLANRSNTIKELFLLDNKENPQK